MLSALDPHWTVAASVAWVVAAQGIAGLAKDFTKTASKSAIKATAAQGAGQLFKWVAYFTGSKNAMKGLGFFVGGLLLDVVGFEPALWLMAGVIGVIFVAGLLLLPRQLGKAKPSRTVRELFAKSRGVNLLAAARIFMFGARDVWFVVGLPVFLYAAGWRFVEVGAFLAAWTIAYGGIQAMAPRLVARSPDGLSREVPNARLWAGLLVAVPLVLALLLQSDSLWRPDIVVVAGLALFGVPFAVNSSLHSYLILAYAGSEKAAEDVGFYYAANATGRLMGILLSGALYQLAGMTACLARIGGDARDLLDDHLPAAGPGRRQRRGREARLLALLRRVGAARRGRAHFGRGLGLAQQHQPARLVVEHGAGVLDDRRRMHERELHRAVLVHMDDVARRHVHAADRDRHVDRLHRHLAMARGDAAQQELEAELADGIDVARRAVRQHADAAHRHHRAHHHLARQPRLVHAARAAISAGSPGWSASSSRRAHRPRP